MDFGNNFLCVIESLPSNAYLAATNSLLNRERKRTPTYLLMRPLKAHSSRRVCFIRRGALIATTGCNIDFPNYFRFIQNSEPFVSLAVLVTCIGTDERHLTKKGIRQRISKSCITVVKNCSFRIIFCNKLCTAKHKHPNIIKKTVT